MVVVEGLVRVLAMARRSLLAALLCSSVRMGVAVGPMSDAKRVKHDWGETDYDWYATRVCKRCGIVHKYDHGLSNGPETFTLGFRTSVTDPGCISDWDGDTGDIG